MNMCHDLETRINNAKRNVPRKKSAAVTIVEPMLKVKIDSIFAPKKTILRIGPYNPSVQKPSYIAATLSNMAREARFASIAPIDLNEAVIPESSEAVTFSI